MSEPVPDPLRDPQLDAAYRAGAAEVPPARLDDMIRAAARREAGSRPQPLALTQRWRMPLAMAAVLVLSVSLVLTLREHGADRLDAPPLVSLEPAPASVAPAQPAPEASTLATSPAAAPREGKAPAVPAPPAPPVVAEAPAVAAPAPARVESAAAAPAAEARSAEPLAAAPRALMRAPAAPAAETAVARSAAAPVWQDLQDKPVEQWRQRILELWRDRRDADAEAVIAEFRRRFPGERLPEMKQP